MDNRKDKYIPSNQADSPKNLVVLRLFEKDNFFLFVYKKTERIVSAIYLTSSLFSDNEPIKWQFREVGIGVISHVLSLTANSPSPLSRSEIILRINSDFLKLLSLLDISLSTGFVSEMNFSILKKELETLIETLNFKTLLKDGKANSERVFDKDFFALPNSLFFPNSQQGFNNLVPLSGEAQNTGELPETSSYTWADVARLEDVYKRQYKGHEKDKESLSVPIQKYLGQHKGHNRENPRNGGMVTNDRQLTILKLLKDKNNLTIKDFSLVIKGCSEKTIQRELLRLVSIGVLKKSGERRWSRYSLVVY